MKKETATLPHPNAETGAAAQNEKFLSRWSRRKTEATDAGTPPAAATPSQFPPDKPEEQLLSDGDMPSLDSLNADSDMSGFLSPKVSKHLRNRALRKIFLSGKFNLRDGLDDYDENFTSFAPLGDIVTAEMRRLAEYRKQRAEEVAEEQKEIARQTAADNTPEQTEDNAKTPLVKEQDDITPSSSSARQADDAGGEKS